MTDFEYGPVEIYLVGFEGEGPDAATFDAIADLVDAGIVRVLDLVIVSKSEDGDVSVLEIADAAPFGVQAITPAAAGLAGEEDVEIVAATIPAGTAAALFVLELLYARALATRVAEAGGVVLRYDRIPAPVVNVVAELAQAAAELESESLA